MSKPKFSPPEPFFVDPLLHLLPVRGSLNDLESLSSSMFAKYQQINLLLANVEAKTQMSNKMEAEASMLRHVLEWLKLNPDALGES